MKGREINTPPATKKFSKISRVFLCTSRVLNNHFLRFIWSVDGGGLQDFLLLPFLWEIPQIDRVKNSQL